jgi:hypothetical protein
VAFVLERLVVEMMGMSFDVAMTVLGCLDCVVVGKSGVVLTFGPSRGVVGFVERRAGHCGIDR